MAFNPTILIIDDTADNVDLMSHILKSQGYDSIVAVLDPAKALQCVRDLSPDLIILDLMMAEIDGYTVLSHLQLLENEHAFLPILVITADHQETARERALSLGATDFLTRPHKMFDLTLRVRNLLRAREMHRASVQQNHDLERLIQERTKHLEDANDELRAAQIELKLTKRDVLERLAVVGEHHDDDTGIHTRRVGRTSFLIAEAMGLSLEECKTLHLVAPLHDVGKIGVPDSILLKTGPLTLEERLIMQKHCKIGAQILAGGQSELLPVARDIALSHHEHWNGKGYPFGLRGEAIPVEGRIVAVADVFDALTHDRPYKSAWPLSDTVDEIAKQSDSHFDPAVVNAFLTLDPSQLV